MSKRRVDLINKLDPSPSDILINLQMMPNYMKTIFEIRLNIYPHYIYIISYLFSTSFVFTHFAKMLAHTQSRLPNKLLLN